MTSQGLGMSMKGMMKGRALVFTAFRKYRVCKALTPESLRCPLLPFCKHGSINAFSTSQGSNKYAMQSEMEDKGIISPAQTADQDVTTPGGIDLLDEKQKRLLQEYQLEYELSLSQGFRVPKIMTDEMWLQLLDCQTKSSRQEKLRKWCRTEGRREMNQQIARKRREVLSSLYDQEVTKQSDFQQRIYCRFYNNTVSYYKELNVTNAMAINHPVVFDSAFDDHLSEKEIDRFLRQLLLVIQFNSSLIDPYHVMFLNARQDGPIISRLVHKKNRSLDVAGYTVSDKSYLDMFPSDRLVYLSPYSTNKYLNYDPEDIFIIGLNDDLLHANKRMLQKAKREQIRHARLPLDVFLKWHMGKKAFPINHVFSILHILAETNGDWIKALKNVIPSRKYSG